MDVEVGFVKKCQLSSKIRENFITSVRPIFLLTRYYSLYSLVESNRAEYV